MCPHNAYVCFFHDSGFYTAENNGQGNGSEGYVQVPQYPPPGGVRTKERGIW